MQDFNAAALPHALRRHRGRSLSPELVEGSKGRVLALPPRPARTSFGKPSWDTINLGL